MTRGLPRSLRRNLAGGSIGSVMDWYDFAVYGYLATIVGKAFFPAGDPAVSQMAAFGVFAGGYAARPVGGALFGWLGDRFGRKPVLSISIIAMGVSTFAIGLLPTYAQIGVAAPVLLIVLRIAQGLCVGGEFPGAMVFLSEHAPSARRGFYASWAQAGTFLGVMLGSGAAALANGVFGAEAMDAWGWRAPFLLSAVIAVAGFIVRRRIDETPVAETMERAAEPAPILVFRKHWRAMIRIFALTMLATIGFALMFVYAASFLTNRLNVPAARALEINTIGLFVMLSVMAPAAILSDRIGRKPVLLLGGVGLALFVWPAWWLMHQPSILAIGAGFVIFAVFYGIYVSQMPSVAPEMLPASVRVSGTAIGYNLCIGTFGGTTPLVATFLITRTGDDFAPVYYYLVAAVLALISVATMKETAGKPLT